MGAGPASRRRAVHRGDAAAACTSAASAPAADTDSHADADTVLTTSTSAGDYIISPRVYNEFVPGANSNNNNGTASRTVSTVRRSSRSVTSRSWLPSTTASITGQHQCGGQDCFVTAIGGLFQTSVPAFNGRTFDFDARLGVRLLNPHLYLAGAYMWRGNNYGYPQQEGVGRWARRAARPRARVLVLR